MKLYFPDYHDQCMEESDAGLYYLASEVDARIADLELIKEGSDERMRMLLTEAVEYRARIAELEKALREAIECVEMWSGYASEYFRDKHDLAGDLKRLRSVL